MNFKENLTAAFLANVVADTELEFSCLEKCMKLYKGPETCSDNVIKFVMGRFAELAIGLTINDLITEVFPAEARTVH